MSAQPEPAYPTGLEAVAKRLEAELASIDGEVKYHREVLAEHETTASRIRVELAVLAEAVTDRELAARVRRQEARDV